MRYDVCVCVCVLIDTWSTRFTTRYPKPETLNPKPEVHKNHMLRWPMQTDSHPPYTYAHTLPAPRSLLPPPPHGADPAGTSLQRVPSTNTSGRAGFNGFNGHGAGGVHTPGWPYRDGSGSHLSFKTGGGSSGAGGIVPAGEREREQELCGEQLDCALEGGGVERNDFDKGNHVSVPSSSERGRERERERESGSESENGAGNKRDSSREGNASARATSEAQVVQVAEVHADIMRGGRGGVGGGGREDGGRAWKFRGPWHVAMIRFCVCMFVYMCV